jgi:hypothetical protein
MAAPRRAAWLGDLAALFTAVLALLPALFVTNLRYWRHDDHHGKAHRSADPPAISGMEELG